MTGASKFPVGARQIASRSHPQPVGRTGRPVVGFAGPPGLKLDERENGLVIVLGPVIDLGQRFAKQVDALLALR